MEPYERKEEECHGRLQKVMEGHVTSVGIPAQPHK